MSANETRNQDNTATVVAGDGAEIIDDTPDWEGPFAEYNCYGEPTEHNCARCPVCGAKVLDSGTSTTSHRPACRYE